MATSQQKADILNRLDGPTRRTMQNLMRLDAMLSKSQRQAHDTLQRTGNCFHLSGRRCGKTFAAVVYAVKFALRHPGANIALCGRTGEDVKQILYKNRTFGIQKIIDPGLIYKTNAVINLIELTNGSSIRSFSAQTQEGPRGDGFDLIVLDEAAFYPDPEFISNAIIASPRDGDIPRNVLITTTPTTNPKSSTQRFIVELEYARVSTRTEEILHLQPKPFQDYYHLLRRKFPNRAKREFDAVIQDFSESSVMTPQMIEDAFKRERPKGEHKQSWRNLPRRFVSVDPSGSDESDGERSEAGILIVGCCDGDPNIEGNEIWCVKDLSTSSSPQKWLHAVVRAYREYECEAVLFEQNFGGKLGMEPLRQIDKTIRIYPIVAHQSKGDRAAIITSLAMQDRIGFMEDFPELSRQLLDFDRNDRKCKFDRGDAFSQACKGLAQVTGAMKYDIISV